MARRQIIRLPMPPPLHATFKNVRGKGRVKTGRYKAWQAEAKLRAGPLELVPGPVAVDITVGRPDKRKRDLDNLLKATLDFLTEFEVIEDDSDIHDLRIRWGDLEGAEVTVVGFG